MLGVKNFFTHVITTISAIYFFIILVGALVNPNLIGQTAASKWRWAIVCALLVLALVFQRENSKTVGYYLRQQLINHRRLVSGVLLGLGVIFQICLVLNLAAPTGFDSAAIRQSAQLRVVTPELQNYYSTYPNNLFLFFVAKGLHTIAKFCHFGSFLLTLDFVNLILVDLSIGLNYLVVKKLNWGDQAARTTFWLSVVGIGLTPWLIVFYSDTVVLPIVSGILLCLASILAAGDLVNQYFSPILLGLLLFVGYKLKPTILIIMIALLIVGLLNLFDPKKRQKMLPLGHKLLLSLIVFSGTLLLFNVAVKHLSPIELNKQQEMPPTHFVMMGLTGEGGYNLTDFRASQAQPTVAARKAYNIKIIKQRLRNYGFNGYRRFLWAKNLNNTADGTFGWGKEGHFIEATQQPHGYFKALYYPSGKNNGNYHFWAQLVWLIVLFGLLGSLAFHDNKTICLQLAILGLLIYLLLFEGGRSRYLIQALPLFFVLAGRGWANLSRSAA
ncbi:hypothetical protein BSQ39_05515 [Loigolactobacillus backii]|uniref:hypothetical protein n=1 Tax=Loigolactobacillus backii TaxID=375175 RepID=UPI000C1CAED6|nr:hypothetical protein [Loigolactobacillus backii]PIO83071.1 hypothetical protein BSQ39_05515 [Loigolactobacillus backii]